MSAPQEGVPKIHLGFDALLPNPVPTFELMDPKTAPVEMLDQVRVNTPGRCLESASSVGTIAVEMYYTPSGAADDEEQRADFFSALDIQFDPEAANNPIATQYYPFTLLPDGAQYEIVVRAPSSAVEEWSAERTVVMGGSSKLPFFGSGVSLAEFRRAFPGAEVDLPEGLYTISATQRTRSTLAVAARVERGEPLARRQYVNGEAVHYKETLAADFQRSALRPDTVVTPVNSRMTLRENGEADSQRLQFRVHDGFQRTGNEAAQHSGLVELIVMRGEAVDLTAFTFEPYEQLLLPDNSRNRGFRPPREVYSAYDIPKTPGGGTSGIIGGETRYLPPKTVAVSMVGIRSLHAVAAFCFALAGTHVA